MTHGAGIVGLLLATGMFWLILFRIRRGYDIERKKQLQRNLDAALWWKDIYERRPDFYYMVYPHHSTNPVDIETDRQIKCGIIDRTLLEIVHGKSTCPP